MTGKRPNRLFCFGLGYSALVLARGLVREGWTVSGTNRVEEERRALADEGIEAHLFSREKPLAEAGRRLASATHVLCSVPPDEAGDPVVGRHAEELAAAPSLAWVGYLSTTGVYGDRGGGWVDERSARAPSTEAGRRRAAAEDQWLGLWRDRGVPVHVFRVAAIYGPGRGPLVAVRAGRARRIHKEGQVFSRIHVADLANALSASMRRPNPGAVYNLCDDRPAPQERVVEYACRLLGVDPPPLVAVDDANLSELARGFYSECKRVSNRRIKEELGVELRYPDFEAGLRALYDEASGRT